MAERLEKLMDQIGELEAEVEAELARQRANLQYSFKQGRIIFEEEVLKRHKELRTGLLHYLRHAHPLVVVSAPVIYSVIVPLVLLDIFVSVYQAICFPVYGIEKVRRADHLVFDRHHLAYLNALEKLNCAYCSYANGLISYTREIAGRTEQYWCPIKHARRLSGVHANYRNFVDYGDAEAFEKQSKRLRQDIGSK